MNALHVGVDELHCTHIIFIHRARRQAGTLPSHVSSSGRQQGVADDQAPARQRVKTELHNTAAKPGQTGRNEAVL